ncbi:lipooligosaccharide transport system permease protein [Actinoplanes octamycinicus]|uniref:Transport permease protein n=1 Tax=Actinoplanes octamycinicus TaxID=135948 RepID=A0A7W7GWC9_9ACTN|nr:ABC transporter permease [Actinoplanes octamycinicus]MBB4739524.1 lipooligosaccharide transport system permease protein [Actinoplanes octamycinicus]GIE54706.1 transport permease protein [Actinoplanes octamycinicus]
MLTLVLPKLVSFEGSAGRSVRVTERNLSALKSAYWVVFASGLVEPVLYLFSIGVGVGALIGDIALPSGRSVSYTEFIAPAMLAASAMSGALTETTFNFFGKMKFMRLYDGMLATPIRPFEIAIGELIWAMARGSIYSVAFLAIMVAMDLTTPLRALAAFPATVLVGFAFGALGMTTATLIRSWQDFDLIGAGQFALFLFSGTFVPAESYPAALRWLVELSPLYRSVDLIRGISLGAVGWIQVVDVLYLLALLAVGLVVSGRRMGRLLCK